MSTPHRMPRLWLVALPLAGVLAFAPGLAAGDEPEGLYELTLSNDNPGQNFSPPVIVLHTVAYRLFEPGELASEALWLLAEDGVTGGFADLVGREPGVHEVIVAAPLHRQRSPVVTIRMDAPGDLLLSVAAMLSLTNDGFVAARAVALPQAIGASATVPLHAWDAGSEANTELCAHVPCETHGQRMTEGAEGAVAPHPGLRGDADIPLSRAWNGPVLGTLTITRLPAPTEAAQLEDAEK